MRVKKIKEIEQRVCEVFEVTTDQLKGKRGKREISDARHVAWWLMVKLPGLPRELIARRYQTSQSAITQAIQKIDDLLSIKDPISDKTFKVVSKLS
ncbi:chromosomal replication initiation protein [compost metagenome]